MCDVTQNYSWISKEFFNEILKVIIDNEKAAIQNYDLSPAIGKGENFNSDLLRAKICYLDHDKIHQDVSLIVKVGLHDPELQSALDDFDVFHREIIVFREILPEIVKVLHSIGDTTKLAAECFATNNNPKYLIFEDLKNLGYANFDRKVGLNFEQLKLTLSKLVKYHAASSMIYLDNPKLFKSHHTKTINPDNKFFIPLFLNTIHGTADACLKWPGFEHFSEKLRHLSKSVMRMGGLAFTRDENAFNVLNHGDLWINNIMFKNDDNNKPEDVLLVDFQICHFGSPGLDLSYLFLTSSSCDVFEKDWDLLLQFYHQELKAVLKKLRYSKRIPTLVEIQMEFLHKAMFGVIFSFLLNGLRQMENVEDADLSNLLNDTIEGREFRKYIFSSENFRKRMEYLLDYFDRKGFLGGLDDPNE